MNNGMKAEARAMIDRLADDATWDDLMYEIYVRQAIESGLADSENDRVTDVGDVRRKLGLTR